MHLFSWGTSHDGDPLSKFSSVHQQALGPSVVVLKRDCVKFETMGSELRLADEHHSPRTVGAPTSHFVWI